MTKKEINLPFSWTATEPKELHRRRMKSVRIIYPIFLLISLKLIRRINIPGSLGLVFGLIVFIETLGWLIGRKYPRENRYEINKNGLKNNRRVLRQFLPWNELRHFYTFNQKLKSKDFSQIIAVKGQGLGKDSVLLFDREENFNKALELFRRKLKEKKPNSR